MTINGISYWQADEAAARKVVAGKSGGGD